MLSNLLTFFGTIFGLLAGVIFGAKSQSKKIENEQLKQDIQNIQTRHEIEKQNDSLTSSDLYNGMLQDASDYKK